MGKRKMIEVKGNVLTAFASDKFDMLIHGCNCFNTMGKGIAKSISNIYPEVLIADNETIKGDKTKLGKYTHVLTRDGVIVNAYTQYDYWTKNKVLCDYDAVRSVFRDINTKFIGRNICIPLIGCGLAHGDWKVVSKIIEEETTNNKITLYYLGDAS